MIKVSVISFWPTYNILNKAIEVILNIKHPPPIRWCFICYELMSSNKKGKGWSKYLWQWKILQFNLSWFNPVYHVDRYAKPRSITKDTDTSVSWANCWWSIDIQCTNNETWHWMCNESEIFLNKYSYEKKFHEVFSS